ncbi:beta-glucosidase 11-like [Spinacia oleracea]|uniref:Beta-glucosidase 11-like n=1 Tax=Spinacia oleracea TaxID=3562 RepID=A0ABM3R108_SPIOL|nr:beta-glucosidase 11-like [Spinacia oleracea]
MQRRLMMLFLWFGLLNLVAADEYNRNDFPPEFVFGASTSAYQVEGAALQDGRTPSIYDTFAHQSRNGTLNPDVACDQYHKYKEDVQLMAETGLDAYRFSISWSRLIPNGRGSINPKGLKYYNNLINELIKHGIKPHVTLLHTDVPQVLEDEYEGFLNRRIIEDFTAYVDVCFREFGDRVRYWTTLNEPNIFAFGGYDIGNFPPGRCSPPFGNCSRGNSTTEPYIAAHLLLLAHGSAVRLYKDKYQAKQLGFVGINLLCYHFSPITNTREHIIATRRTYDFLIGWFMHPLTYGDYPEIMKKNAGRKIPIFTEKESKLVKGSFDFIGINYYSVMETNDYSIGLSKYPRDFFADIGVEWKYSDPSVLPDEFMFPNEPWGLERVLEYFKDVYQNPLIFIHENGQVAKHSTATNDQFRVEYIQSHIGSLLNAVRNGSDTRGYFVWSLMDVYELLYGFKSTFGLYHVDFNSPNLTRQPKLSQKWYSGFLKGKNTTTYVEKKKVEDDVMGRSSI